MAVAALAATTVAVALVALAVHLDPVPAGLAGSYYTTTNWSGAVVRASIGAPSTRSLTDDWGGTPPPVFSATWSGVMLIRSAGRYTFASVSDDGSRVYVDGRLVVDNGGVHGVQQAIGSIALDRGVHAIFLEYFQAGGDLQLDLLWAREGKALQPIPAWLLAPRRTGLAPLVASALARRALVVLEWAWFGAILLTIAAAIWWVLSLGRAWAVAEGVWPALAAIVAVSALLDIVGVWWGLPGGGWAPDEITPASVLDGVAQHFSHAWYNAYPPLHFYLLAASFSPMLLLDRLGRIDVGDPGVYFVLALVGRLLTVVQALGTVIAAYACGARAFGRKAGLFAAAMLAIVAPFLYYAKTTNFDVPYLFWFALSMVFYLRLLDEPTTRDLIGFAVMATCSVCTKDQAYGLFVLPPIAIAWRLWTASRVAPIGSVAAGRGGPGGEPNGATTASHCASSFAGGRQRPRSAAAAAWDVVRLLAIAGAVAVVLFALIHNLAFNSAGFVLHIRDITGTRSSGYKMFAQTPSGWAGLFRLSAELLRLSMGWPMLLVCVAGAAYAAAVKRHRGVLLWLVVPALSYYVTFLNVVLYTYDRFLLPICFVLVLCGGLFVDRVLLSAGRARAGRVAVAAAVFGYTLLYAAMVDVLMVRDSRYAVEPWLEQHVAAGDLIGFTFPLQYYPRLGRYRTAEIDSAADLARDRPEYFVLDVDYARAEPPTSDIGRMIAGLEDGTLGYRRAFVYRTPAPWRWLPGAHPDLVGPRLDTRVYSTLHHVNPTIAVFRRAG